MGAEMNQKWKVTLSVVCVLCLSGAVHGQKLPDGKGKAELVHDCTDCHGTDMIIQKRRTPEDWKKVVDDMAARGSNATPKDIDNIIRYLSTDFGVKATNAGSTPGKKSSPSSPSNHQN